MPNITIASIPIPNWQGSATGISLNVYVNSAFIAETGTVYPATVPAHLPHSGPDCVGTFFLSFPCTVSETSLTIPAITLDSTTDSPDNPAATYSAVLWDNVAGQPIQNFGSAAQFPLPASPTSTTWEALFPPTATIAGSQLTVGTVTELAPGAAPTATISGSKPYLLNLGVPQGIQGVQGVQGMQGVQGVPGPQGPGGTLTGDYSGSLTLASLALSSGRVTASADDGGLSGYIYTIEDADGRLVYAVTSAGQVALASAQLASPTVAGGTFTGSSLTSTNIDGNTSAPVSSLSGWLDTVEDADGRIVEGIDSTGAKFIALSTIPLPDEVVDAPAFTAHTASLNGVKVLYFEDKATQTQTLLPTTGNVTQLRVSGDGTKLLFQESPLVPPSAALLYAQPPNTATASTLYYNPATGYIGSALTNTGVFTVWSDSLGGAGASTTATAWPNVLASATDWTADSQAIGGQTSSSIGARQGGVPILVTLTGNSLAANGATTVTSISSNPLTYGPSATIAVGSDASPSQLQGTLLGVPVYLDGTVNQDSSGNYISTNYTVVPVTAMSGALAVPANTPFLVNTSGRDSNVCIFVMGQNDASDQTSENAAAQNILDCVNYLKPLGKRYLVVNSAWKEYLYNAINALGLPAGNVVDIRSALFAANGQTWDGTWPEPGYGDDGTYGAASIPSQYVAGWPHFNDAGQAVWASAIHSAMAARGWV